MAATENAAESLAEVIKFKGTTSEKETEIYFWVNMKQE